MTLLHTAIPSGRGRPLAAGAVVALALAGTVAALTPAGPVAALVLAGAVPPPGPAATPPAARPARPAPAILGRSVQGRAIQARVLGSDRAPRAVLLVGCIHGNECAAHTILSAIARRPLPPRVRVWLVQQINPDGTAAGTRQNARGVDLNRNFPYRWQRISDPVYYSGRRPASEPETRVAMALIRRIKPAVTIWYHQHEDLVDMAGGDRALARRYAHVAGLRATCLRFLPGTATGWSNRVLPGTTAFVVELPAGPVGPAALRRHLRALVAVENGRRTGSRLGCGG